MPEVEINPVLYYFVISMSTAVTALTLSRSNIFLPLRIFLGKSFIGRMLDCPYCTAHWTSLFFNSLCIWNAPKIGNCIISFILNTFTCIGLACFFIPIIFFAISYIGSDN